MAERLNVIDLIKQKIRKVAKGTVQKTCPWRGENRTEGGGMMSPKMFLMCDWSGRETPYYCQTPPWKESPHRGYCEASTGKMAKKCLKKLARGRGRKPNQKGRPPYIMPLDRPGDSIDDLFYGGCLHAEIGNPGVCVCSSDGLVPLFRNPPGTIPLFLQFVR